MIEIDSVRVAKSGTPVFDNFSFSIKHGEHWIIRGNNGVGKTTLLEVIAGIITPTEGRVSYSFIERKEWVDFYTERRNKIHYVSAHAMNNFLSGHHDLFYQQRYYDMGEDAIPVVRDLLGTDVSYLNNLNFPPELDIENLLDLEVTRLSNGQLKKLLLLKAFIENIPNVLLLDYPFEGLDQNSRADLCTLLDHLASAHSVQLIIVDHDHELPSCINRVLTIHQGGKLSKRNVEKQVISSEQWITSQAMPDHTESIVDLRNVSIRYGDRTILNNLNWTITKGERWALTGKNGCGKTTLFSLLYADHPLAYTQEIYLFGRKRGTGESIWDIKKRISYLGPEHLHYLNPRGIFITGREYICSVHGQDLNDRISVLAEQFDAIGFMDKPVRTFSSGQLQTLLLINFFLADKELLLLDEPFQFLDRERTDQLNVYLEKFLKKDTTLILITHNSAEIRRWTQRRMNL